ncbi:hypothetical protein TrVFT333_006640 [Trichoderma virens FT-333]|nr:hypothetical protein TrVFT333_006640 [Trichoderma virens FT-333]
MLGKLARKLKFVPSNRGEENYNKNVFSPPAVDATDTPAIDMRDVKISSETTETKSPSQTCRSTSGLFENDQGEPPQETRHLWETSSQTGEIFNVIEIGELWDAAYDGLTVEEPELIAHYENLVSMSWNIQEITSPGGKISKRRRSLINALDTALAKNSDNGRQNSIPVFLFNKTIQTMSRKNPKAVLAWVALYFSAQSLLKAKSVLQSEFSTHVRILPRIELYCNLATLRVNCEAVEDDRSSPFRTWSSAELKSNWITLYRIILLHFIQIACMGTRECRKVDLSSAQLEKDIIKQEDILITSAGGDQAKQVLANLLATIGKPYEIVEPEISPSLESFSSDDSNDNRRDFTSMGSRLLDSLTLCKRDPKISKHMENWAMSINQYTDFRRWDPNTGKHSLWVNGAPGYGKTNLLLAMANELLERKQEDSNAPNVVCYFGSCGSITTGKITSVIHQLTQEVVRDQPLVAQFLEDRKVRHSFDTTPDFATIFGLLLTIIKCDAFLPTYFILDGLDELSASSNAEVKELHELLGLICEKAQPLNTKVQWLVSADTDFFTKYMNSTSHDQIFSITLDSSNVGNGLAPALEEAATLEVNTFLQDFDVPESFGPTLGEILFQRSGGNFLWIKLASKIIKSYRAPWNARTILDKLGDSIAELYEYSGTTLDSLPVDDPEICKKILLAMAATYGPLSISELRIYADVPREVDVEMMITRHCSCFLEVHEGMVYFAHPSAKGYLRQRNTILQVNSETHFGIALRSLSLLSESLQDKIGHKRLHLGGSGALQKFQYASLNWIQHLTQIKDLEELEEISNHLTCFLDTHLIRWLDAVTPMYRVSDIVTDFERLECRLTLAVASDNGTISIWGLENNSVRPQPDLVFKEPGLKSIQFSTKQHLLASVSRDGYLRVRSTLNRDIHQDLRSGITTTSAKTKYQTQYYPIDLVTFSLDGNLLASASDDGVIFIWDGNTGEYRSSLTGLREIVIWLQFSSDGSILASSYANGVINVWNTQDGSLLRTLKGHKAWVRSVSISPDNQKLASTSDDGTTQLWKIDLYKSSDEAWENYILDNDSKNGSALAFSSTGTYLVSETNGGFLVWNLTKPNISATKEFLPKNAMRCHTIAFLPGTEDVFLSVGDYLEVWNIKDRTCVRISNDIPKRFLSMELSKSFPGYIFTEIGTYYIGDDIISPPQLSVPGETKPKEVRTEKTKSLLTLAEVSHSPYALNEDRSVITWKNKDLIFLPDRYRPCKDTSYGNYPIWIHGRKIAIGCESGRVVLFNFAGDKDPVI